MPEFMVVLRGTDPELKQYSPTEASQIMERYYDWVDKLKQDKRYLGGSPFRSGSKLLSGHKDFIVIMDGPYAKSKDALTGYFVLAAEGLPEAVELAKGCPALGHGETVEVIELNN